MKKALTESLAAGFCKEEDLPSDNQEAWGHYSEIKKDYLTIENLAARVRNEDIGFTPGNCSDQISVLKRYFPALKLKDFVAIAKAVNAKAALALDQVLKAGNSWLWKGGTDLLHSSTIVGQRWNSVAKTCEFLIRNSWGSKCSCYSESLSSQSCEAGNVWVDTQTLLSVVHSVQYIKP